MNQDEIQKELLDCIRLADRRKAVRMLEAWEAEHGDQRLIADVLEPVLKQLGELWQQKELFTLAQAYVAGKIVEDI